MLFRCFNRGCRTCWSWGLDDICDSLIQSETYLLGVGHLLSKIKANEPDIAGKSALKMTNLHNLKVIRPKRAKILLCKGEKFYRRLYAVRVVPHLKVKSTIRRCCFGNRPRPNLCQALGQCRRAKKASK